MGSRWLLTAGSRRHSAASRPAVATHPAHATALLPRDRPASARPARRGAGQQRPGAGGEPAPPGCALQSRPRPDWAGAVRGSPCAVRPGVGGAPGSRPALNNRGTLLHFLGRLDAAIASFQRARVLRPDDPTPRFNEGLVRLALVITPRAGRGTNCAGALHHPVRHAFTQPQWRGEDVPADRTILLHAEQGYGDTLQFCRYVPLLARAGRRGAAGTLRCDI